MHGHYLASSAGYPRNAVDIPRYMGQPVEEFRHYTPIHFFTLSLATDFSFISSMVNIPFATEEQALTVYNCSAAVRYIARVKTQHVITFTVL